MPLRFLKSNVAGQAYALMVITPILPGQEGDLRARLERLDPGDSPLARLPRTHFGRWVILEDLVQESGQRKPEPLGGGYLIFTACLDGDVGSYLDELCERLAPEAREIWGRCAGCPPGAAGAELKAYLLRNRVDSGLFVAAYPNATVAEVERALAQRVRTIEFAVRTQGMAPADLQRAFAAELAR